jgi:tetratricopeptide (TPR) repeat protein
MRTSICLSVLVVGGLLVLAGSGMRTEPVAPKPDAPVAGPQLGAMNPIEDYREERLKAALRGLRYESGEVTIDEEVAPEIAQRGTPEEAMVAYDEGLNLLEVENLRTDAIAAFTRSVIIAPEEPEPYYGLGLALSQRGRMDQAEAAFRTALQHDGRYVDAQYQLAETLWKIGRQEDANAALRRVIELDGDHAEAHSRLSIGLYYVHDYSGAWDEFRAAEALGYEMPAQFRPLLEGQLAEPAR